MNRSTPAFTLVELSIVLVILGLLVGGVLAGQSLIRAAELRAVSTEYNGYITALHSFRDKYFAPPGDMRNAVRYWGAQAGTTDDGVNAACIALATGSTTAATCNGDGNGIIGNSGATHEVTRSWQHLANAGLVEGSYGGVGTTPGVSTPRSQLSSADWRFQTINYTLFTAVLFPAEYNSTLSLRGDSGVLKAEEAYNIDVKMDDGKPHTGILMVQRNAASPACVAASDTEYNLSDTTKGCARLFFFPRM